MDVDGVNNLLSDKKLLNAINKKKWNAIFPNQLIFITIFFALRIENLIEFNLTKIKKKEQKILNQLKNYFQNI